MNLLEKRNTNATTVAVPKGTNYRTAQHIADNARPVAKGTTLRLFLYQKDQTT